ncbi:MAG: hypothetical protein HYX67_04170 [Candidatus Melainabacteria bacterium]|nr:hypothetical protein [Candidatus Melainabacteria bacterium]
MPNILTSLVKMHHAWCECLTEDEAPQARGLPPHLVAPMLLSSEHL